MTKKEYSQKTFLLEIDDHSLLKAYLKTYNITYEPRQGDNPENAVKRVQQLIAKHLQETQSNIESDFVSINHIADAKGVQTIIQEAEDKNVSIPTEKLEKYQSNHDIILWFFINHKSVFEGAFVSYQFLDTTGWKRVPVPVKKSIGNVVSKAEALKSAIRKHYQKKAHGKHCYVEPYLKKDCVYVVVGIEDYARSVAQIDPKTGVFNRRAVHRPFIEVYYLYRPESDELEIKALGNWQTQQALLKIFAQAIFNTELEDKRQTYQLDLLKDPDFRIQDDPTVEYIVLKRLDLRYLGTGERVSLDIGMDTEQKGTLPMWDLIRKLGLERKMQNDMVINKAYFQFKFKKDPNHTGNGSVTFSINWKDTCTLNSFDPYHIKAQQLLKNSNIDCGFTQYNTE